MIGSFNPLREFHLTNEHALLNFARRVVVMVIEPDLANRQDFGGCGCWRIFCVRIGEVLGVVRVNADRGVNPIVGVGDGERRIQAIRTGASARNHDVAKARGTRPFNCLGAIDVKIGVV